MTLAERLKYHVSGAIARGEAAAIKGRVITSTLRTGYEPRYMTLTVQRVSASRKFELRLSDGHISVHFEVDGQRAPYFKTKGAAVHWAVERGLNFTSRHFVNAREA